MIKRIGSLCQAKRVALPLLGITLQIDYFVHTA